MAKSKDEDPFAGLFDEDNKREDIFGSEKETSEDIEIFEPRKVKEFKEELLAKGEEADKSLSDFDILVEDMSHTHARRVNRLLGNMTDVNFMANYLKLLGYIKPKVKAVEADIPEAVELSQINVTVINSKDEI